MRTQSDKREGRAGVQLHTMSWLPDGNTTPRADVVLVHGYGEHSGRYAPVAERLTGAGFAVWALDHRGHGLSSGIRRGEVDSFDALVDDLGSYVADVTSDRPLFVYGHSMGGLATVRLAERRSQRLNGLVLTGSALATAESIPAPLVSIANILGRIAPGLPTIALDGNAISKDEKVRSDYDSDPLNYRGKLSARTGRELNIAMRRALEEAPLIREPMLIMHGAADTLAAPRGSRTLSETVSSTDVTYREWPGAYHELHHEPERDDVLGVIVNWLTDHT